MKPKTYDVTLTETTTRRVTIKVGVDPNEHSDHAEEKGAKLLRETGFEALADRFGEEAAVRPVHIVGILHTNGEEPDIR